MTLWDVAGWTGWTGYVALGINLLISHTKKKKVQDWRYRDLDLKAQGKEMPMVEEVVTRCKKGEEVLTEFELLLKKLSVLELRQGTTEQLETDRNDLRWGVSKQSELRPMALDARDQIAYCIQNATHIKHIQLKEKAKALAEIPQSADVVSVRILAETIKAEYDQEIKNTTSNNRREVERNDSGAVGFG